MHKVNSGLGCLLDEEVSKPPLNLKGKKIGLISNQTGVTKELEPGYQLLASSEGDLKYLFAPEHGFFGAKGEAVEVENSKKQDKRLPIISLYGKRRSPPKEILEELDLLIYDIQDLAVRCYTYIYTMINSMKAAARTETDFLILDRPPPLSGEKIEGSTIEDELNSFIGSYELTMVYGLTPGELARYVHFEHGVGQPPKVVKMVGWERRFWFDRIDLPWVPPSPGMPTFSSVLTYPATVLLESTNVSEGRGTTKPFEYVGSPWIRSDELSEKVRELANENCLGGFKLRGCRFIPRFSQYRGRECQGFQIHVSDRFQFSSFEFGLLLVKALRDLYPDKFHWWNKSLERGVSYFDRLTGSKKFRKSIDRKADSTSLIELAQTGKEKFKNLAKKYFLYT